MRTIESPLPGFRLVVFDGGPLHGLHQARPAWLLSEPYYSTHRKDGSPRPPVFAGAYQQRYGDDGRPVQQRNGCFVWSYKANGKGL